MVIIAFHDRNDGRIGGGVAVYAKLGVDVLCIIKSSEVAERSWHILHTDAGPLLLGPWYRPPDDTADGIDLLAFKCDSCMSAYIGSMLLGDFNVHHVSWLRFSSHTCAAGVRLKQVGGP